MSLAPEVVQSPSQYKKLVLEAHDLGGDVEVSESGSMIDTVLRTLHRHTSH